MSLPSRRLTLRRGLTLLLAGRLPAAGFSTNAQGRWSTRPGR
jgi:hypothetical protein